MAPDVRESQYGVAGSEQAAIRLAERVLPPGAEYVITTLSRTAHHARTRRVEPPRRRSRTR